MAVFWLVPKSAICKDLLYQKFHNDLKEIGQWKIIDYRFKDIRKLKYKWWFGLKYKISHHTKLLVRREVRLYTPTNFFAEIGGYLGLLLGENLLSYLMLLSTFLVAIRKKLGRYWANLVRKNDKKYSRTNVFPTISVHILESFIKNMWILISLIIPT